MHYIAIVASKSQDDIEKRFHFDYMDGDGKVDVSSGYFALGANKESEISASDLQTFVFTFMFSRIVYLMLAKYAGAYFGIF